MPAFPTGVATPITLSPVAEHTFMTRVSPAIRQRVLVDEVQVVAQEIRAPATVSRNSQVCNLYVRGADNALWQRAFFGGQWHPWERHEDGVVLMSEPALGSMGPDHEQVFIRGTDNQIWQKWWTAGSSWSHWVSHGAPPGGFVGAPATVSRNSQVCNLYVRGADNALWQRAFVDGQWHPWERHEDGVVLMSEPALGSMGPDHEQVFIRGTDNQIWQKWWTAGSGWSHWVSHGAPQSENLPLANTRNGNWFKDRFDAKIIWYLPSFTLVDDPDAAFAFEARQTGTDVHGNPFNKCRLMLGLKKVIPADIIAWSARDPSVQLREVPLNNFNVAVGGRAKNPDTGEDQPILWQCSVAPSGDSILLLSIDNILGDRVIVLYENLVNEETTTLSVAASYDVWQQTERIPRRLIFRAPTPVSEAPVVTSPAVNPRVLAHTEMMARPTMTVNRFATSSLGPNARFRLVGRDQNIEPVSQPKEQGSGGGGAQNVIDLFERESVPFALGVPIARKFAADPYRLKFTVAAGETARPILGTQDLRNYDVKQSEFTELKLLGNISERYSSIRRLYLGILSRTIIVIPSRYVILRQTSSCAAICNALVDSSPGLNAGCKFQFEFTLAPDVSPIDLVQLSQDINGHPETKGCTLSLPDRIKDGPTSTLVTPFATSFHYANGSGEPHTFLLSMEIKEAAAGLPAVANANMLIEQLRSVHEPFLSGTLGITLDDAFPTPIEVPVLLNFKETIGTAGIFFRVDESLKAVILTNGSSFDLNFSRCALVTPQNVTVIAVGKVLSSGQTLSLPLPADHAGLNILVDADLAIADTISKEDLFTYLQFETVDVQNTQYTLGVNGATINFDSRGIDHIDLQISLTNLPQVAIPALTILKLRKLDSTNILVPIAHAMGELNATLLCTIHFTDAAKVSARFTMQTDFVQRPIFMLKDSDFVT